MGNDLVITTEKIATLTTELESAYALMVGAADQLDSIGAREGILHAANLVELVITEFIRMRRELKACLAEDIRD